VKFWYLPKRSILSFLFSPIAALISLAAFIKRKNRSLVPYSIPIIVVGNITVGGTGKTPTIIWLVKLLQSKGYKPGVVSRGYGSKPSTSFPVKVDGSISAYEAGDEPKLIFNKTHVPVVIDPKRDRAVRLLCDEKKCDVIVSDDGMQHYSMFRDIEILMVDALRGFGNRSIIPSGPLREPITRKDSVDFILSKESGSLIPQGIDDVATAHIQTPVNNMNEPLNVKGVVVCSGIGNFESFVRVVESRGFLIKKAIELNDHQKISNAILENSETAILVTEKDFIKLIDPPQHVYQLPFDVSFSLKFEERLLTKLKKVSDEKSHHNPGSL
jgi:tetraacyldisaccharide 4'-kinase